MTKKGVNLMEKTSSYSRIVLLESDHDLIVKHIHHLTQRMKELENDVDLMRSIIKLMNQKIDCAEENMWLTSTK